MNPDSLTLAVTGSSGFIGRMLCPAFTQSGHSLRTYDLHNTWVNSLLNTRYGGPFHGHGLDSASAKLDILIGQIQKRVRRPLLKLTASARSQAPDICSDLNGWVERFRGCDAVIHLAAIPHPNVPGLSPRDYERINYEGACSIYQAARQAGVSRFVYASSCQTYFINRFSGWKRFPIQEEDADAIQAFFRPHDYGYLKWKFENYLKENSLHDGMTSLALRLEMPGLWGAVAGNLFIQTSVENLQQAFLLSCTAPVEAGAHILNIADDWVPESLVHLPDYTGLRWQGVSCDLKDNTSLLSLDKAKSTLGYHPVRGGTYHPRRSIF